MVERSIILIFALGSKLWFIVAVIAALALLTINPVSANGSHMWDREVFSGLAGPYDIRVLASTQAGNLHIRIWVSPLGSDDSVSDAVVQVSGRGPQNASQVVEPVQPILYLAGWYNANLLIEVVGEWVFTLTVESSLGEATVDFPIEVQESGSINWGVLGAVAFFLTITAWLALKWGRRKGK